MCRSGIDRVHQPELPDALQPLQGAGEDNLFFQLIQAYCPVNRIANDDRHACKKI